MFIKTLMLMLPLLISVAFLTLLERKMLSLMGNRMGPNKPSLQGIMQPFSDAMKLMQKQSNNLSHSTYWAYYSSSGMMLMMTLLIWATLSLHPELNSPKYTLIYIMVILGINSLSSIVIGWSTSSKFSIMGSLRTVAQLISYESLIYICMLLIIMNVGSFKTTQISNYLKITLAIILPLSFMIWLVSILADLNRTPYDFAESESELVSGFNTEFGSKSFTALFLAEYGNILFFSMLTSYIFLMKMQTTLMTLTMILWIIWMRAVLPRTRFDMLMKMAWKILIPVNTILLLLLFTY